MYELLFRSRWYAFAGAVIFAVSAIVFTTNGLGVYFTGTATNPAASEEAAAKESKFRSWAADTNRHSADEHGSDPSSPDQLRGGEPRDSSAHDPQHNPAPFAGADGDDSEDDSSARAGSHGDSSDEGSSDEGKGQ